MRDTIYRDEAIDAVMKNACAAVFYNSDNTGVLDILEALPSAEAEPTVIRSRTFMPTKDFKEWAKRIREENPNAVVIPCDAEVVSADAVQGEWIMHIDDLFPCE